MAPRHASLLVALMSATVAVGIHAWGPQAPPDKPIAIVGGLLIDATGAPPRMDQTVPIYDAANPPDFPELHLGPANAEGGAVTTGRGPSFNDTQRQMRTSKENVRRFIKEGVKFSMGTDTGAFMDFQQEDPNASELMYSAGKPRRASVRGRARERVRAGRPLGYPARILHTSIFVVRRPTRTHEAAARRLIVRFS
jgi:hypothetical protein